MLFLPRRCRSVPLSLFPYKNSMWDLTLSPPGARACVKIKWSWGSGALAPVNFLWNFQKYGAWPPECPDLVSSPANTRPAFSSPSPASLLSTLDPLPSSLSRVWPSSGRKLRLLNVEGSQGPFSRSCGLLALTRCGVYRPLLLSAAVLKGGPPSSWVVSEFFPVEDTHCFSLTSSPQTLSTHRPVAAGGLTHMLTCLWGTHFHLILLSMLAMGICFAVLVALYNVAQEFWGG